MGMYTKFELKVLLKHNIPKNIILLLNKLNTGNFSSMNNVTPGKIFEPPHEHIFWSSHRATYLHPKIKCNIMKLSVELKNYDLTIEKFLDFIYPFVDCKLGDIVGSYESEQAGEESMVIYTDNGFRIKGYAYYRHYKQDYVINKDYFKKSV